MLSIIIPSRVDQFLQKTVDDLLLKAQGDVEVIVILDGYWTTLNDDKRVKVIHQGMQHDNFGMRAGINAGVKLAEGEFIMKIDEHCAVGDGYDRILAETCQPDWVVIPRRKRLDPESWTLIEDGRPPIDYMFVSYPYKVPYDRACGLYGAEDRQRYYDRLEVPIDDTMTMQGSCWFLRRDYFYELMPAGMDEANYGPFNHEAQEISNAAWLSGGRVMVNKNTWYAHYHKGNKGKGYGFSNAQYRAFTAHKEKARRYAIDYWLSQKDYKYDWAWFIDKFWPVPTWPADWQTRITEDAKTDWRHDPSQQPSEWLV
jgi:glycosyltransferase involved in cell wall biosynthesis